MGGKNREGDDPMEWSDDSETAFLEILVQRLKNNDGVLSFKSLDPQKIDEELFSRTGIRYGEPRLRGKYNRLRIRYRQFSELVKYNGVTIDVSTNMVSAPDVVWDKFFKKDKIYKTFKRVGCKNYDLLDQLFNNSTTTGLLHCASTQPSPTSDEEHGNENQVLNSSVHASESDKSGPESSRSNNENKRMLDVFEDHCFDDVRVKKQRKDDELGSILETLASCVNLTVERMKGKYGRYAFTKSSTSDPYSIEECMDALESMDGVSDASYFKALEKFTDAYWRKIFIKMSDRRKRAWLNSLVS